MVPKFGGLWCKNLFVERMVLNFGCMCNELKKCFCDMCCFLIDVAFALFIGSGSTAQHLSRCRCAVCLRHTARLRLKCWAVLPLSIKNANA